MTSVSPTLEHFMQRKRDRERRRREAVSSFIEAAKRGDVVGFGVACAAVDSTMMWPLAMRRISRCNRVPKSIRRAFRDIWIRDGDHVRGEVKDDRLLIDGLKRLLLPYVGPARVVYRGDSAWNGKRRTYGLSWTTSKTCARSFASGIWRTFDGGSVVLQVKAPADSIIAAIRGTGESEYILDRRRLRKVTVIERFSQLSPDEYHDACSVAQKSRREA